MNLPFREGRLLLRLDGGNTQTTPEND
jgi:hypothetical protein